MSAVVALVVLAGGCAFGASPTPSSTAAGRTAAPHSATPRASASGHAASASAAASAGALGPGTYARVTADGLYVHINPKAASTRIGQLFFGDVVLIRAKAAPADGYTWFEIESVQTSNDQRLVGYIAGGKGDEAYLSALPGPPLPTPSHSASPTAAPSAS